MIPIVDNFVVRPTNEGNARKINNRVQNLNKNDIHPIVNVLGEHYSELSKVEKDVEKYKKIIGEVRGEFSISIKPTQLGLDLEDNNQEKFNWSLYNILKETEDKDIFVWIDMESYKYLEDTVKTYLSAIEYFDNLGICLQANIKRTDDDLKTILDKEGIVRLVKGAYKEDKNIAYQEKEKIDSKYKELIDIYSEYNNGRMELGTHDKKMIQYGSEKLDNLEVQMLMGIRSNYQEELARKEDINVSQYVPYGSKWIPYFWRRIRENKANLIIGLRNSI